MIKMKVCMDQMSMHLTDDPFSIVLLISLLNSFV